MAVTRAEFLTTPFANSGAKTNPIPVPSQPGGAASYTDGFPPLTRTPIASGGIPPSGLDMNGILFQISAHTVQLNAGLFYYFDGTFAAAVGGYEVGAMLLRADNTGFWFNTQAANTNNPDTGGAGWVPAYNYGVTALTGLTNANVTLTALQYSKPIITLAGTLTGNINIIFPTIYAEWIVVNNTTGAFSITAKTASGSGVPVQRGGGVPIFCDGTNILTTGATAGAIQAETYTAYTDTGAANAYVITPSPAITAYAAKQRWQITIGAGNTNTAGNPTPTVNINGLGTRNIVKQSGAPFIGGELVAASTYDFIDNGTSLVLQGSAGRTRLTADLNIYVSPTGADTLGTKGVTSGSGAFATIQYAWDFCRKYLDLNGFNVTCNVANGTYTGGLVATGDLVCGGIIQFTLNFASTSAIVSTTSADAILATGGAKIRIVSGTLQTASGNCLNCVGRGSRISFRGTNFGVASVAHMATAQGEIVADDSYSYSGAAQYHYYVDGGNIALDGAASGRTITGSGTLAFTTFCTVLNMGSFVKQNTWTYTGGTITGQRYNVQGNSIINVGGSATFFPGNVNGTTPGMNNGLYY